MRSVGDSRTPLIILASSGLLNVMTGIVRGLGYSILSMVICISCVVGGSLIWVLLVYPHEYFYQNIAWLLTAFPFSRSIAVVLFSIILTVVYRKLKARYPVSKISENKV